MIIPTLRNWLETIKALVTNPRALASFAVLYLLLLATLYGFISTREATVWQVIVTLFFLVLIPAEFFILQATIVRSTQESNFHWPQILRDSIKLAVVTIPVILLGYVIFVLLNKWQAHYPIKSAPLPVWPSPKILTAPSQAVPQPLHWPTLLFATARSLLFGVALPLASIHLWIEVAARDFHSVIGGGALGVLKRLGRVMARAFTAASVFAYALGLVVFALIPYALLFVNFSAKGTKTDFALFVARLLLVFAFTLVGWIVTVSTLARMNGTTESVSRSEIGVEAEAPA